MIFCLSSCRSFLPLSLCLCLYVSVSPACAHKHADRQENHFYFRPRVPPKAKTCSITLPVDQSRKIDQENFCKSRVKASASSPSSYFPAFTGMHRKSIEAAEKLRSSDESDYEHSDLSKDATDSHMDHVNTHNQQEQPQQSSLVNRNRASSGGNSLSFDQVNTSKHSSSSTAATGAVATTVAASKSTGTVNGTQVAPTLTSSSSSSSSSSSTSSLSPSSSSSKVNKLGNNNQTIVTCNTIKSNGMSNSSSSPSSSSSSTSSSPSLSTQATVSTANTSCTNDCSSNNVISVSSSSSLPHNPLNIQLLTAPSSGKSDDLRSSSIASLRAKAVEHSTKILCQQQHHSQSGQLNHHHSHSHPHDMINSRAADSAISTNNCDSLLLSSGNSNILSTGNTTVTPNSSSVTAASVLNSIYSNTAPGGQLHPYSFLAAAAATSAAVANATRPVY